MSHKDESKPRVAVIGLGSYFAKLKPGIHQHFEPVAEIDLADYAPGPGGLRSHVQRFEPDAVMLLTPNKVHADQIVELAPLGVPVFAEKPLVTTLEDLRRVEQSLEQNPRLYCSDLYVDVFALPLLSWLGCQSPPETLSWVESKRDISELSKGFGPIRSVEARLLEGTGSARSLDGREWLWDRKHGGMLWDLAYHHVALWFSVIGEPLEVLSTELGFAADGQGAEIYADVRLRSASGVPFHVEVGKYADADDRAFRLEGSGGEAEMLFGDQNVLRVRSEGRDAEIALTGDGCERISQAFRNYVDSGRREPHRFREASEAVRVICEARGC